MKKNFIRFIAAISLFSILLCSCSVSPQKSPPQLPDPPKYEGYPTVIIDAGHGGEDSGAIGINGCLEKHLNLEIALLLEQMLRAEGVSTQLTRTEDILLYDRDSDYKGHKKLQDMTARISIANEYDDAIFVSIHMNSFTQEKYSGLQVYFSDNSPLSYELAKYIQDINVKLLQPNNKRQVKSAGTDIYLLKKIEHPAVLVECGFISNTEECALLSTEEYRQKLCFVIYSAILEYFDATENNTSATT